MYHIANNMEEARVWASFYIECGLKIGDLKADEEKKNLPHR